MEYQQAFNHPISALVSEERIRTENLIFDENCVERPIFMETPKPILKSYDQVKGLTETRFLLRRAFANFIAFFMA